MTAAAQRAERRRGRAREDGHAAPVWVLSLYVTGSTPNSLRAIRNVRRICDAHLGDRYQLDVVDVYQQPALASEAQILAAPTLVKEQPLPVRRLIGDMSDEGRVLVGLSVRPTG